MFHRNSTVLVLISALAAFGCESSSSSPQAVPTAAKPTEAATATNAAKPAKAAADEQEVFWSGGTMTNATTVALKDVLADPSSFEGKPVRVEGEVTRVCQGMGCWLEIADGDASLIVKSLDHSITFPKDGAKHRAQVEGTVRVDPESSCSDEKHAHEQKEGEPPHECPQPKMLIEVRAAKLLAKAAP